MSICLFGGGGGGQKSFNHILPFSQGSRPSYDTTWEEAVRGCTIRGYDNPEVAGSNPEIYLKMYPVSFPCGLLHDNFYEVILMKTNPDLTLKKSLSFDGCSSFQSPFSVHACSDKTAAYVRYA